jgi:hypothetical protein
MSFGFAEVLTVEDRRPEIVRVPDPPESAAGKATYVFTRLVADPVDTWRRDPEREINRQFTVPSESSFVANISARHIGTDPISDSTCRNDLLTIDDRPIELSVSLSGTDVIVEPCDGNIALTAGTHILKSTARRGDLTFDRIVLGPSASHPASPTVDNFTANRSSRKGKVSTCPNGCWLELADGWNTGWSMTVDDQTLDDPIPSVGGRNTWFLDASSDPVEFSATWRPQRIIWIGLGITFVTIVFLFALLARRGSVRTFDDPPARKIGTLHPAVIGIVVALTVSPLWGLVSIAPVMAASRLGRTRPRLFNHHWNPTEVVGAGLMALGLAFLFAQQIRTGAQPGFGWPSVFERSHRVLLTGLLLVLAGSWGVPDRDSVKDS